MGFINCEWLYNAIFLDKKLTKLSGNGITYDEKIYVLKELDFNKAIGKLDILVMKNQVKMKNVKTLKEKYLKISSDKKSKFSSSSDGVHYEDICTKRKDKFSNLNKEKENKNENKNENEIEIGKINIVKKINKISFNYNEEINPEIQLDKKSYIFSCFNFFK